MVTYYIPPKAVLKIRIAMGTAGGRKCPFLLLSFPCLLRSALEDHFNAALLFAIHF